MTSDAFHTLGHVDISQVFDRISYRDGEGEVGQELRAMTGVVLERAFRGEL